MAFDIAVKQRAYQLDPEAWESYSGKPVRFKRAIEIRRTAALKQAQEQFDLERGRSTVARAISGEDLYKMWAREMDEQGVGMDSFEELDGADQDAWRATAEQLLERE